MCRRDDIESLLYVLLELYHGTLPWDEILAPSARVEDERTLEMKAGHELHHFLLTQSTPEFQAYYMHYRSMSFEQEPDYNLLRQIFRQRLYAEGWECDENFDWMDPKSLKKGTLIPDEYEIKSRFVQYPGVDVD